MYGCNGRPQFHAASEHSGGHILLTSARVDGVYCARPTDFTPTARSWKRTRFASVRKIGARHIVPPIAGPRAGLVVNIYGAGHAYVSQGDLSKSPRLGPACLLASSSLSSSSLSAPNSRSSYVASRRFAACLICDHSSALFIAVSYFPPHHPPKNFQYGRARVFQLRRL